MSTIDLLLPASPMHAISMATRNTIQPTHAKLFPGLDHGASAATAVWSGREVAKLLRSASHR